MTVPVAIESPLRVAHPEMLLDEFDGSLTCANKCLLGRTQIVLSLLPVPDIRFRFASSTSSLELLSWDRTSPVGCVDDSGTVRYTGCITSLANLYSVEGPVSVPVTMPSAVDSAKFLIVNGPKIYGSAIQSADSVHAGRLEANCDAGRLFVDALDVKLSSAQFYAVTHIAKVIPSQSVDLGFCSDLLFRALSIMRCAWVGVVGPWLYDANGKPLGFHPFVTKCTRLVDARSWCHEQMSESFDTICSALHHAYSRPELAPQVQTALHWMIESNLCAGGVEGSLILQQAALELLSWFEVVNRRRLSSAKKFNGLKAKARIKELLQLFGIDFSIPSASTHLVPHVSAALGQPPDLVDLLVNVRNVLVHAKSKQIASLVNRSASSDEHYELWLQTGGLLQQAFLAALRYKGRMLSRRDNVGLNMSAKIDVDWT